MFPHNQFPHSTFPNSAHSGMDPVGTPHLGGQSSSPEDMHLPWNQNLQTMPENNGTVSEQQAKMAAEYMYRAMLYVFPFRCFGRCIYASQNCSDVFYAARDKCPSLQLPRDSRFRLACARRQPRLRAVSPLISAPPIILTSSYILFHRVIAHMNFLSAMHQERS